MILAPKIHGIIRGAVCLEKFNLGALPTQLRA